MMKPGIFLTALSGLLLAAAPLYAQKQVLTLDTGAPGSWVVGVQPGTVNQLLLSDYPDDYTQGVGSMKVDAKIRNFAAAWGTWTDAQWTFPTPLNIAGYDDIRFDMRILTPPHHAGTHISDNRNVQFVIDLYDSVYYQGAGNVILWRYSGGTGDLNMFYYPHDRWISPTLTGWFEVVIPISALRYPNWWTPIADGVFHGNHLLRLGFGVDGDSSAADSVSFLIDNIRATKKATVIQAQSMDGPASGWVVGTQPGANIKAVLADYPDDYIEGTGSLLADVAIRTQAAGWGSWTDMTYNYATRLNATGATELRFSYKTVTPTTSWKRLQFVVDLYDSRGGPWRWANGFGQFGLFASALENNNQHTWTEVAIPINDLTVPSWASADTHVHLDSLLNIHFGVDADSSGADSVKFLLDNFYFTKLGAPDAVDEPVTGDVPQAFRLEQNYPNPFNPSTRITFALVQPGKVSLKVYNLTGQLVETVLDGVEHSAGKYQVDVNLTRYASGAYFYVLQQGAKREAKMMMLLK
jgi:hypothetical protein